MLNLKNFVFVSLPSQVRLYEHTLFTADALFAKQQVRLPFRLSGSAEHWTNFVALRLSIKTLIEKVHSNYLVRIEGLFELAISGHTFNFANFNANFFESACEFLQNIFFF